MPQLKGLHIDVPLSNYSQKYKNAAFVNEVLFPPLMVEKESDLYFVYGTEMFNVYEAQRANGARSNEIDWTVSTSRYAAEQYSLSGIVTDRERSNADKPLTVDIDTLELLQDTLDLSKEYRAAQIARNAANYTASNTEALSGTAQWDQYSSAKPLTDIKTMKSAIWKASRKMPNTIVIPTEVGLALANHPDIIDLRKYTDPNLINDIGLPTKLLGLNVVTAGAGYNSASLGATASLADVWGKDVIMAFVDTAKIKSMQYGLTFRTTKYVRKWRDEPREGDIVEVNDINDVAMVANGCGYLLQTAIS